MKRFRWIALLIAVSGCAVAAPPNFKIAVLNRGKPLPPKEWCSITFTFNNTRSFQGSFWMEATVLDAENKTVDERFVTFPSLVNSATPVGPNRREVLIYTPCDRIRQVTITGNGGIVEPNTFAWTE